MNTRKASNELEEAGPESHPTLANGRYVVKRYIGRGGMAAVFLVYDNTFKIQRAIKVLDPPLVVQPAIKTRFQTEAQAMARLNHPNIVRVYDQGSEGMTSYIVMDYLPHGSLQHYLDLKGPLSRELALCATLDLADALGHAHDAGIIHRDIKPDNALLSPHGALLTDFGLARVSDLYSGLTQTRAVMGTPAYMSPEQRLSAKAMTHRTDIYALTATLFSLLTCANPLHLYDTKAQGELLKDLDADIADLIRRGCHARPMQRFDTAADLAAALEALREVPGAPRTRITSLPLSAEEVSADLHGLRRLWASYTTPVNQLVGAPREQDPRDGANPISGQAPTVDGHARSPGQRKTATPEPAAAEALNPDGAGLKPEPSAAPPRQAQVRKDSSPPSKLWPVAGVAALSLLLLAGVFMFQSQPASIDVVAPLAISALESEPELASYDAARRDLLAGNLGAAATRLRTLMASHPDEPALAALYGAAQFCRGERRDAATSLERAAKLSHGRTDVLSQMLLYGAEPFGQRPVEAVRAGWAPLRGDLKVAELDLLYLILSWSYGDHARLADDIKAARQRFTNHAVFALLDIHHLDRAANTVQKKARVMDALKDSLALFPDAYGLTKLEGALLYRGGQYEAAAQAMSVAVKRNQSDADIHLILGNTAALRGLERERVTRLMLVMGDEVSVAEQHAFAIKHGLLMAGLGQIQEADKLWDLAQRQLSADLQPGDAILNQFAMLQARLRLQIADKPQWRAELARQKDALAQATLLDSSTQQRAQAELLFLEGVAALQNNDLDTANSHLEALEAHAEQAQGEAPRLARLLALDIALKTLPLNEDRLAELSARVDPMQTPCVARWAQARVAAALAKGDPQKHLPLLIELSEAAQSGDCMVSPAHHVPMRAHVHLLLAEFSLINNEVGVARAAVKRFDLLWSEAPEEMPFVYRMKPIRDILQARNTVPWKSQEQAPDPGAGAD